jgi:hypothetical protein
MITWGTHFFVSCTTQFCEENKLVVVVKLIILNFQTIDKRLKEKILYAMCKFLSYIIRIIS